MTRNFKIAKVIMKEILTISIIILVLIDNNYCIKISKLISIAIKVVI